MRFFTYGFISWNFFASINLQAETVKNDPISEDCDGLYYGIEQPKDFAKALQCYKALGELEHVITMLLNGEGEPYDPRKIEALFVEWQAKDPEGAKSMQAELLKRILADRKKDRSKLSRYIDYCKDVALDTYSMNACQALDKRRDELVLKNEIQRLGQNLDPQAQKALTKLTAVFFEFSSTERSRVDQLYSGGTIRSIEATSQEHFLREHFQKRLRSIVSERRLPTFSESEFRAADKDLNKIYRSIVPNGSAEDVKLYTDKAKAAQIAWIKYRDAWVDLIMAAQIQDIAKTQTSKGNTRAVKTLITIDRIDELKNTVECR